MNDHAIKNDVELYARMAAPYESKEDAAAALAAFIEAVQSLREEHRISEIIVVAAVHGPADPDSGGSFVQSVSRGNSEIAAQLAAMAYARYAQPAIAYANRIEQIAKGGAEGKGRE